MLISSRYIGKIVTKYRFVGLLMGGLCLSTAADLHAQSGSGPAPDQVHLAQSRQVRGGLDARIVSMPKEERKLEVIQNRSQLVRTRKKVVKIAISDPTIIDIAPFEANEFAIIGGAVGSTTFTLWFEDDDDPLIYEVKTIADPDVEEQIRIDYGKLERKIAILFPNSKVYLIPLHEKLVVKGQVRDGADAARILQIIRGAFLDDYGGLGGPGGSGYNRGGDAGVDVGNGRFGGDDLFSSFIVNMLQVPGEFQVMLHVTIAELNHSQLRNMGVDINYLFANGRHAISSALAGGTPTLTGIFENGDIGVLINALASNGTAKILSRPSLTTLSGQPATFLAGGEFAVPTTVNIGGAGAASTQFRGFGTSMTVLPTVVDGDLIRLRITPEFSRIDPNNSVGGIPGLSSRRVQTTVELREGQSIVLGGLLSRQSSTEVSRIPYLGEIPLIGPVLFNTKRASEDELELIVLVTPELVRAMDPDEVPPMPGYYVTHPSDTELFRHAMTEGAPDTRVHQLAPYGNHVGAPTEVGFNVFNPSPATPQYAPIPQANQPNGFPSQAPWMNQQQSARYNGSSNGIPVIDDSQMMPGDAMDYPQEGYGPPMMAPPSQQYPSQQQQYPSQQYPSQQYPTHQPSYGYPGSPSQMSPGYQQGPPAGQRQGQEMMAPMPDPGASTYRGGNPTASTSRQQVPNYSRQQFNQQPQGNQTQYIQTGYGQRR